MKNLWYLVAAYSSVFAVIAVYLLVLLKRNSRLEKTIAQLEQRLESLEKKRG